MKASGESDGLSFLRQERGRLIDEFVAVLRVLEDRNVGFAEDAAAPGPRSTPATRSSRPWAPSATSADWLEGILSYDL